MQISLFEPFSRKRKAGQYNISIKHTEYIRIYINKYITCQNIMRMNSFFNFLLVVSYGIFSFLGGGCEVSSTLHHKLMLHTSSQVFVDPNKLVDFCCLCNKERLSMNLFIPFLPFTVYVSLVEKHLAQDITTLFTCIQMSFVFSRFPFSPYSERCLS